MIFITLAFFLVTLAQPDWSILCCICASALGFALFWQGISFIQKKRFQFLAALLFFGFVQAIQLSWFLSDKYVGFPIYLFFIFLTISLGTQFALATILILNTSLHFLQILAGSCLWVMMEYSRLKFLTGYTLNPLGLMLTASLYSMNFAAFVGIFGLSFWVFFANLLAFKWLKNFKWRNFSFWMVMALIPYAVGYGYVNFHQKKMGEEKEKLHALVVQTAISPEEKYLSMSESALYPIEQVARILSFLEEHIDHSVDLILLSESTLPYAFSAPIYSIEDIKTIFSFFLGAEDFSFLPKEKQIDGKVGNNYFAQALANFFNADVIIGLEDVSEDGKAYNAAFLFTPRSQVFSRYEKRILLPLAEYIPFNWCKRFLKRYGIEDSFTAGKEAKVFLTKKAKAGVSICYEETFSHLMRENRLLGAQMLINLTNDVWYPYTRLPMVHYLHGRVRAVENGILLLRSCNTGVSCGIDCLGRTVTMLPFESKKSKAIPGALFIEIPLYHCSTLYAKFGDSPLVLISFLLTFLFLITCIFKKRDLPLVAIKTKRRYVFPFEL